MALSVRPLSLSCLPGNESQLVHRLAFVTEHPLKAISFHMSLRTDARRESHQMNDQMNGSQATGTRRCCRVSLRHVPCDATLRPQPLIALGSTPVTPLKAFVNALGLA